MFQFSLLLFPLFLVSSISADPKVLYLNLLNSWVTSVITGVEPGAALYVASSDDNDFLKDIFIKTANVTISLDQINGPLKYLTIIDGLSISTRNNDTVVHGLTGFLYVTTKQQADDPNFSVHVVKTSETIIQKYGNSTAVILNTSLQNYKVSYLTEIIQNPETNLSFHFGFPTDGVKIQNSFFENPIYLPYYEYNGVIFNTTKQFFKTVEPIQIKLDYWYLIATGPVSMKIGGQFVPNYNYTTTALATTGLIMNYDNDIFQNVSIHFGIINGRSRIVGTLISTFLSSEKEVRLIFSGDNGIGYEQR